MRNYDEMRSTEEEETFVIRGETFKLKRVRPEVMDELLTIENEFLAKEDKTYSDIVAAGEAKLLLLLDESDDAINRWKALRERAEDPVTYREIMDISKWAFEVVSGFPTMQVAPLDSGVATTSELSRVGSS